MDEVFVVTNGVYSDYRIMCVFPDEAGARAYVAKQHEGLSDREKRFAGMYGEDYRIEAWTLETDRELSPVKNPRRIEVPIA